MERDGSTITLSFQDGVTGKLFVPLIEIKKGVTHLQWELIFTYADFQVMLYLGRSVP